MKFSNYALSEKSECYIPQKSKLVFGSGISVSIVFY